LNTVPAPKTDAKPLISEQSEKGPKITEEDMVPDEGEIKDGNHVPGRNFSGFVNNN